MLEEDYKNIVARKEELNKKLQDFDGEDAKLNEELKQTRDQIQKQYIEFKEAETNFHQK